MEIALLLKISNVLRSVNKYEYIIVHLNFNLTFKCYAIRLRRSVEQTEVIERD